MLLRANIAGQEQMRNVWQPHTISIDQAATLTKLTFTFTHRQTQYATHTARQTGNAHLVHVHRVTPFVIVLMTGQDQVNTILVQQRLDR